MTTNFNTSQFHNGVALPMIPKNIYLDQDQYLGPPVENMPASQLTVDNFGGVKPGNTTSAAPGEIVDAGPKPTYFQQYFTPKNILIGGLVLAAIILIAKR